MGYARTGYDAMKKAFSELCTEFRVSTLVEDKTVIDKRPTVQDVKSLEQ